MHACDTIFLIAWPLPSRTKNASAVAVLEGELSVMSQDESFAESPQHVAARGCHPYTLCLLFNAHQPLKRVTRFFICRLTLQKGNYLIAVREKIPARLQPQFTGRCVFKYPTACRANKLTCLLRIRGPYPAPFFVDGAAFAAGLTSLHASRGPVAVVRM